MDTTKKSIWGKVRRHLGNFANGGMIKKNKISLHHSITSLY
jgi:hypothetical protein